jgi:hypothetical protein
VPALLKAASFYDLESFALFQIMTIDAMDITPLLCVVGRQKGLLSF